MSYQELQIFNDLINSALLYKRKLKVGSELYDNVSEIIEKAKEIKQSKSIYNQFTAVNF